jgi:hypothetical protein
VDEHLYKRAATFDERKAAAEGPPGDQMYKEYKAHAVDQVLRAGYLPTSKAIDGSDVPITFYYGKKFPFQIPGVPY